MPRLRTSRTALAALAALVPLVACRATTEATATSDAATRLAALRRALGGDAALAQLDELRATYACNGPSGGYHLELALEASDAGRIAWHFPNRPASVFAFERDAAWLLAEDGARTALAPEEAEMVRSHAFARLVAAPEEFLGVLARVGTTEEGVRSLERLAAASGSFVELDRATDLPLRITLLDRRAEPPTPVVVRFERWRELDGVLLPDRVVAVDGRGEWVMELEAARFGRDGD